MVLVELLDGISRAFQMKVGQVQKSNNHGFRLPFVVAFVPGLDFCSGLVLTSAGFPPTVTIVAWIPGLKQAPPEMTVLVCRRYNQIPELSRKGQAFNPKTAAIVAEKTVFMEIWQLRFGIVLYFCSVLSLFSFSRKCCKRNIETATDGQIENKLLDLPIFNLVVFTKVWFKFFHGN